MQRYNKLLRNRHWIKQPLPDGKIAGSGCWLLLSLDGEISGSLRCILSNLRRRSCLSIRHIEG